MTFWSTTTLAVAMQTPQPGLLIACARFAKEYAGTDKEKETGPVRSLILFLGSSHVLVV